MKSQLKSNLPVKLARGRERFEEWRSKQKSYHRLPKHLWSLAARLAHEYGISQTAHALRLDYNYLKKHMGSAVSGDKTQTATGQQFFQLLGSELTATVECVIECEDTKGTRIRIQIKGRELPYLETISKTLWNNKR